MVATTDKPKTLTLEAFLALPETKPASEYCNRVITQKPMPKGKHSRIQSRLAREIDQVAEDKKIALTLTELRCTIAGRSIVPDIAVIRWDNLPRDEDGEIGDRFDRHPDWIIEILSPDQPVAKVMEKIIFCLQQGSELGWLIDPNAKSLTVFQSGLPKVYFAEDGEPEAIAMIEGLETWQLSVQDIFGWLKV